MTSLLPQVFYSRAADVVARDLIGALLVSHKDGEKTSGIIVEAEAYLGALDPASHAYRGPTARNKIMFGAGGYAYIYFSYGVHYCFNATTGPTGVGQAVLIRALQPLEGVGLMQQRRGQTKLTALASGPGKLVQALGVTPDDYGLALFAANSPLQIYSHLSTTSDDIMATPRIGISKAVDLPLRFTLKGSSYTSRRQAV